MNTKEKLQGVASLLTSVKWSYSFHVGLVRDLLKWSWLDGTSVDSTLFDDRYPKITEKGENCIVFSGYTPDIINKPCNDPCGYACQSAQGEYTGLGIGYCRRADLQSALGIVLY